MRNSVRCFLLSLFCAAVSFQCSTPPPKETADAKPELLIQVGSLSLSNFNKRIEKKDIGALAKILKREQIEIFAVQSITRYPGVDTRVDFVDELSARTEMRNAFGETLNNSGRQTGNAVFSSYPIRSNTNKSYGGLKSETFDAALQAIVDGGVRDIAVVSTQIPLKISPDDQSKCVRTIAALGADNLKMPAIIAGNLPATESIRTSASFDDVQPLLANANSKSTPTRVWYTGGGRLKPLAARTVDTEFGPMVVVQFGIYR